MSKKLVVYFSGGGVTKAAAEKLAEAAGLDIYEIKPVKPYTRADLYWPDPQCRSILEMKDPAYRRPPIADTDAPVADYDTILLGFPIWCYKAPTIVNTFLEAYDFSGKTIILFATSGGSGFSGSVDSLRPSVSDTTVIKEGRMLNRRVSAADLRQWVESL